MKQKKWTSPCGLEFTIEKLIRIKRNLPNSPDFWYILDANSLTKIAESEAREIMTWWDQVEDWESTKKFWEDREKCSL